LAGRQSRSLVEANRVTLTAKPIHEVLEIAV
jgi:hypothetical protein